MKRLDSLEASYRCCWWGFWLFIALLVVGWLTSCTTTKVVTVEKVKTDTTYITKHQRDSIWLHDSIYVHEWMKGDTVYRDRIQCHTKYVEKQVRDTIYQHRVDSVPQPYPYAIYKDRELSTTQVVLMTIGGLAIMALFVFIAVKLKRYLPCR